MIEEQEKINRRTFLKTTGRTAAATVLAATGLSSIAQSPACAQTVDDLDKYDFLMPRVKFDCDMHVTARWNAHPSGDKYLLDRFSSVVRCKVKHIKGCKNEYPIYGSQSQFNAVVDLTNLEQLRKYPFLFMMAEGSYTLGKKKKQNLKKYIQQGGFILMDDCVYKRKANYFYLSSFSLLEELFGAGSVKRIPIEHEVFHNVYDLSDVGLPYMQGQNHGARGFFIGDRLAVFLSPTDIHCGWADRRRKWFRNGGRYGKHSYEEAIQMGVNIIMYVLSH